MFLLLRELMCHHKWKLIGRSHAADGSMNRHYACEICTTEQVLVSK